ncbi:MAG TPA: GH25 family lysozyme [Mycobacteriales bacterium]|nr:GH25 family lysozyme [Mycobacteriales bacterium]
MRDGVAHNVDWAYWWGQGKRFAYVKATEGTTYRNPYFTQQYNGSYNIDMIRHGPHRSGRGHLLHDRLVEHLHRHNGSFGATSPLWIARYAPDPGTLPNGWSYYTFWQYTSTPLDQDYFNGAYDRLRRRPWPCRWRR